MQPATQNRPHNKLQIAHRMTGMVYLLYLLGFLFGITALIGVMINHTHLHKTRGTYAYTHFIWQIISFWVLFAGVAGGIVLLPSAGGVAIMWSCLIWWLCSALFGIWFLSRHKPLPLPFNFST